LRVPILFPLPLFSFEKEEEPDGKMLNPTIRSQQLASLGGLKLRPRKEEAQSRTAFPHHQRLIHSWWWMLYDCRLLFPFSFIRNRKKRGNNMPALWIILYADICFLPLPLIPFGMEEEGDRR
jgi:hypothetical protein